MKTRYPAIVLAGGLGTRLRSVIADTPKPMATINGQPFLHYVFAYLQKQGVTDAILSVGYRSDVIKTFFGDRYLDINIKYSTEEEPLGTGGGIKQAFELVRDAAYVLNGDTFFDIDLNRLSLFHEEMDADVSLALKPMLHFDRYGTVELSNNRVYSFQEKKYCEQGLINGGVYFMHKNIFSGTWPAKFSFERDVLERFVSEKRICGEVFNDYFIDIGIPDDYAKAQEDFKLKFGAI